MKKIIVFILLLSVLLQAAMLSSCNGKSERFTTHSFDYFDTVTTIIGYAKDQTEFDKISGEILEELGEYHKLFDIYKRYEGLENLCTINELVDDEHRTVKVDKKIIDMLLYAKEMHTLTGGKVNVAMGSVLSIWHDYRQAGEDDPFNAELPPIDKLTAAAEHTDINDMMIDEANSTVTLKDPKMKLDVGAIAKGYAVEMIAKTLYEKGISGYILNVGGNVRTIGGKNDGKPWTAGIQNPDTDGEGYLCYIALEDKSLVTSGSYQRYYIVDGKEYHHIIDQSTLMPAQGYTSVSIICESSAMADALSTALFCMELSEGQALIGSLNGVEAMWVTADGQQYTSSGFEIYKTEIEK